MKVELVEVVSFMRLLFNNILINLLEDIYFNFRLTPTNSLLKKTCAVRLMNISLVYFIVIYFSLIGKQAIICLCKSRSNLFLEPTSTKQ